jgi:hypothetical protein
MELVCVPVAVICDDIDFAVEKGTVDVELLVWATGFELKWVDSNFPACFFVGTGAGNWCPLVDGRAGLVVELLLVLFAIDLVVELIIALCGDGVTFAEIIGEEIESDDCDDDAGLVTIVLTVNDGELALELLVWFIDFRSEEAGVDETGVVELLLELLII